MLVGHWMVTDRQLVFIPEVSEIFPYSNLNHQQNKEMGLWPHCSSTPFSSCSLAVAILWEKAFAASSSRSAHLGLWQQPEAACARCVLQVLREGKLLWRHQAETWRSLRLIASSIPRAACDQAASALRCLSQEQMPFFSHWQMQHAQNPGTFLKMIAEAIIAAIPNLLFISSPKQRFWEMLALAAFCRLTDSVCVTAHPKSSGAAKERPCPVTEPGFWEGFLIWVCRKCVCYFWYKQSR